MALSSAKKDQLRPDNFSPAFRESSNFWLLHHDFNIDIGDTIADRGTMAFITKPSPSAERMQIIEDASHDEK